MTRLIPWVLTFVTATLLQLAPGLPAQEQLPPASQQELALRKYSELTESMQRLHAYLAKAGDKDDIAVLRAGMTLAQERHIDETMDRIKLLLEHEQWDDGLKVMEGVRKDLMLLLEVLQNRNTDLQKLLEQLARLQDYRNEVDRLAKEQASEKEDSARAEELQKQLEAIEQAKAAAAQLLAEQKQVRENTNALGLQAAARATEPLARKEQDLGRRTDKLANDLGNIEKKAEQLAAKADPAVKPGDKQPAKPGGGSCSGSAKAASQSMQKAEAQLGQKKPESSLRDQDQAIEKLQATMQQLDEMAEKARRELEKLPFDQQAKRQEQTQHATDTLAQKMEKAEQDGENGEGKPTPGRKSVQQAVPKQKAAAGTLKEYRPAKQKQQDAKEDLEKARDELDEAINQLRQQLIDEVLRALEERFTAMLQKQRELSLQTKTLDTTRSTVLTAAGGLPAALVTRIQTVASGEQDLETEAADAGKLLAEDGTTSVFPEIVEELRLELRDVAKRCRANATDKVVQDQQAEVEETLTLLINSLRRVIEQREGGQGGQCNGQPPLVPISAELKVLKFLQEKVNKRTKDYDQGTPPALRETDEARGEAGELSVKQARVRELTRRLASKLNQENQTEEHK